jgi:hypothetical protein
MYNYAIPLPYRKGKPNPYAEMIRVMNSATFVLADSGWVKGQRPVPLDGQTLAKSLWIGQGHD